MPDLSQLEQFAVTERQVEVLRAVIQHGSNNKAAKALKINRRQVDRTIESLKSRAAKSGFAPEFDMIHQVPEGFGVKGVSTLYGEDGQVKAQWVKSQAYADRQAEVLKEIASSLSEEIIPAWPITAPKHTIESLLNQYTITDYHIGMMAWHEESGEDFDIKIAEELLLNWFATAIKASPDAHTAIFAQIGDYLHWDGLDAVTPTSRHLLDADTRFQKIVRVAIRCTRQIIRMLLEKHAKVHVIMADANHDPASGIWLREFLSAHYDTEPRVTVDINADSYYCYEHGLTSLFYHHGHKRKPANIDDVFVAKYREVFGRTKYSYAHMGHLHHVDIKETNLMIIEQHRTLAAHDAYASRGGYMAGRDAKVITYHKDYGEVGRITISPEMVKS